MKRNTKGMLGALEIAMIVVVVGILGFVGWRITQGESDEVAGYISSTFCEAPIEEYGAGGEIVGDKCVNDDGEYLIVDNFEQCKSYGGELSDEEGENYSFQYCRIGEDLGDYLVPLLFNNATTAELEAMDLENNPSLLYPSTSRASGQWIQATIDELGLSFDYPEMWGTIEDGSDELNFLYLFSDFDGLELGVASNEVEFEGGVPINGTRKFSVQDGKLYQYFSSTSQYPDTLYDYELTENLNCAYSTNVNWWGKIIYHAICNLKTQDPVGINIYTSQANHNDDEEFGAVNIDDFVGLIESVEVN